MKTRTFQRAQREAHGVTVSSVRQLPDGRYAGQRLTIIVLKNLRCARYCYRDALDATRVPGKDQNIYTYIHKYIYADTRTHAYTRTHMHNSLLKILHYKCFVFRGRGNHYMYSGE